MPDPKTFSQGPERAVRDLWKHTLSQVPTTFGRIVYLASLRDTNTGRYEHFGLAQIYSDEDADRAIRLSHAQVFAEWLNYPLSEQKADLEEYLLSLDGGRPHILRTWSRLAPYKNLLPIDASEAERQLFVSDLELILELLESESCPSARIPDA
jgi:hypothetical protein